MEEVSQKFKIGGLSVSKVHKPSLASAFVLVLNHSCLLSARTDHLAAPMAPASVLRKARHRTDVAPQVVEAIKKEGVTETRTGLHSRLATLGEVGCSVDGTLFPWMDGAECFKPRGRVGGGGGGQASHECVAAMWRVISLAF